LSIFAGRMFGMKKLLYICVLVGGVGFITCGSKTEKPKDSKFVPSDDPEENKKHFKEKKVIEENQYASTPGSNTNTPKVNENGEVVISDPNFSPETVVKTIINAAKTGNYVHLAKLTTQVVKMDGDAKKICNMANESEAEKKSFNAFFANAFIRETRLKSNLAEVDISTTTKEGKEDETIIVEQKYGKWYLKGL